MDFRGCEENESCLEPEPSGASGSASGIGRKECRRKKSASSSIARTSLATSSSVGLSLVISVFCRTRLVGLGGDVDDSAAERFCFEVAGTSLDCAGAVEVRDGARRMRRPPLNSEVGLFLMLGRPLFTDAVFGFFEGCAVEFLSSEAGFRLEEGLVGIGNVQA